MMETAERATLHTYQGGMYGGRIALYLRAAASPEQRPQDIIMLVSPTHLVGNRAVVQGQARSSARGARAGWGGSAPPVPQGLAAGRGWAHSGFLFRFIRFYSAALFEIIRNYSHPLYSFLFVCIRVYSFYPGRFGVFIPAASALLSPRSRRQPAALRGSSEL